MSNTKFAPASAVRAFAAEQGIPMGSRGRLNPVAVEAFNKANKKSRVQFAEKAYKPTVAVRAIKTHDSGRKTPVTKAVNVAEVRAAALAAGVEVGKRGRLTQPILAAYVTGDWSSLTA
jgi:hypothetical protein